MGGNALETTKQQMGPVESDECFVGSGGQPSVVEHQVINKGSQRRAVNRWSCSSTKVGKQSNFVPDYILPVV